MTPLKEDCGGPAINGIDGVQERKMHQVQDERLRLMMCCIMTTAHDRLAML